MIYYEGDSPDEAALLEALRENDILFTERTTKGIKLSVFGKEETYEILKVVEFSSARKRMTIIVRGPEGSICLLLTCFSKNLETNLAFRDFFIYSFFFFFFFF